MDGVQSDLSAGQRIDPGEETGKKPSDDEHTKALPDRSCRHDQGEQRLGCGGADCFLELKWMEYRNNLKIKTPYRSTKPFGLLRP